MDKFKSHLLTALGVAVVMLTIMLFTSRQAITQSTLATTPTKIPFQIQVSDPGTGNPATFNVPTGRILVIENVGLLVYKDSYFGAPFSVPLTTIVGGAACKYPIPFMPLSGTGTGYVAAYALVPTHLYAEPGSTVTVDNRQTGGTVSISGYLTKTLP